MKLKYEDVLKNPQLMDLVRFTEPWTAFEDPETPVRLLDDSAVHSRLKQVSPELIDEILILKAAMQKQPNLLRMLNEQKDNVYYAWLLGWLLLVYASFAIHYMGLPAQEQGLFIDQPLTDVQEMLHLTSMGIQLLGSAFFIGNHIYIKKLYQRLRKEIISQET